MQIALSRTPQSYTFLSRQLNQNWMLPTLEETTNIKQLKSGKAAGGDGIPAEIWKHGRQTLHSKLHELFLCCWEQGKLPQDLRDAVQTIGGSPCFLLLVKSLPGCYWTDWSHPSLQTIAQKASAVLELREALQTWCLLSGSCRRNAGSRIRGCT